MAQKNAVQSNQSLFPLFDESLRRGLDRYIPTANKLADWLSRARAYYAEARPVIVGFLETAYGTVLRERGPDVVGPLYISNCPESLRPWAEPYARMVLAVMPFYKLFPERELRARLQTLFATLGIDQQHVYGLDNPFIADPDLRTMPQFPSNTLSSARSSATLSLPGSTPGAGSSSVPFVSSASDMSISAFMQQNQQHNQQRLESQLHSVDSKANIADSSSAAKAEPVEPPLSRPKKRSAADLDFIKQDLEWYAQRRDLKSHTTAPALLTTTIPDPAIPLSSFSVMSAPVSGPSTSTGDASSGPKSTTSPKKSRIGHMGKRAKRAPPGVRVRVAEEYWAAQMPLDQSSNAESPLVDPPTLDQVEVELGQNLRSDSTIVDVHKNDIPADVEMSDGRPTVKVEQLETLPVPDAIEVDVGTSSSVGMRIEEEAPLAEPVDPVTEHQISLAPNTITVDIGGNNVSGGVETDLSGTNAEVLPAESIPVQIHNSAADVTDIDMSSNSAVPAEVETAGNDQPTVEDTTSSLAYASNQVDHQQTPIPEVTGGNVIPAIFDTDGDNCIVPSEVTVMDRNPQAANEDEALENISIQANYQHTPTLDTTNVEMSCENSTPVGIETSNGVDHTDCQTGEDQPAVDEKVSHTDSFILTAFHCAQMDSVNMSTDVDPGVNGTSMSSGEATIEEVSPPDLGIVQAECERISPALNIPDIEMGGDTEVAADAEMDSDRPTTDEESQPSEPSILQAKNKRMTPVPDGTPIDQPTTKEILPLEVEAGIIQAEPVRSTPKPSTANIDINDDAPSTDVTSNVSVDEDVGPLYADNLRGHRLFLGSDMIVMGMQNCPTSSAFLKITFDVNAEQLESLKRWANRHKIDDDMSSTLCLTLGCYLSEACLAKVRQDKSITMKDILTGLPCVWPRKNSSIWAKMNDGVGRKTIVLTPPFLVNGDNLIDASVMVDAGTNVLHLYQRGDLSEHVFALHLHRPTVAQLTELQVRRDKEKNWKDYLKDWTQVKIPKIQWPEYNMYIP